MCLTSISGLPDVGQPDYCGVGWDLCTLSNTCIKVVHELQNLEGANATCVSYAGRLIEITSADIQSWLEEYLSALGMTIPKKVQNNNTALVFFGSFLAFLAGPYFYISYSVVSGLYSL